MRSATGLLGVWAAAVIAVCMMMFVATAASAATPQPAARAAAPGASKPAVVTKAPAKPPTQAPSAKQPAVQPAAPPTPSPDSERVGLVKWMWSSTLGAALLGFLGFALVQFFRPNTAAVSDKDLEASRISYGFWLILGGLLLTLAVVIITLTHFGGQLQNMSDVIAIITSVTGVVGTLTAAFFGIQAAGAGRSQALSALGQMQGQTNAPAALYKIEPSYGPHAGNTSVSITGNALTGASAVNFGATPGTNLQVINDGLIRVTTPPMPLERTGQKSKSDNVVTVVYPSATANREVGTFYYYTIELQPDTDNVEEVNIYGTGLTGATAVKFGDTEPIKLEKAVEGQIQIEADKIRAAIAAAAQKTGTPPPAVDPAKDEVEVAVIFAPDSPTKQSVIGRLRLTPFRKPKQ